jgi:hypothetical protein
MFRHVRKVIDANKRGSSGCWDARGNYLFSIEGGRIVATLIHPVTGVQLEKLLEVLLERFVMLSLLEEIY